jgi:hypothetical protein
MRIENLELSPGHPEGAKTGPPPGPRTPGLQSSTPLKENEGFPGSGVLESGPPGLDFEGSGPRPRGKILESENANGPRSKRLAALRPAAPSPKPLDAPPSAPKQRWPLSRLSYNPSGA